MSVIKEINPRTKLVPLTMPANVLPKATFNSQSKSVTGATHRLEETRRYVNRTQIAIVPTVMGLYVKW